ncbi:MULTISPECIES: signal peptidase I [Microbacterium]|uniref:signal peptidase I n=1 Tax=Microbacterium TaxID=33882 RepID=UPI0027822F6F|nr:MULTISPECIES: signal peptidase I [Microbacterium]MDQ1082202.1 signal peptidase I [Microbacterium sp. SORGH_AS_0344]MDQ1169027.1 signal peptidase I [Microbacterium proteolyticum]
MTDIVATTTRGRRRAQLAAAILIALLAAVVATVLSLTGARLFVIETASMAETAPVGTLVVAHPKPAYAVGDVITFVVDGRTVTHRIVGVQEGRFITQGDLNGSPDAWQLQPDQIVGTVVAIVPGLGFLLKAAPVLFLAGIVVETVARLIGGKRRGWRVGLRLTGWSVAVSGLSLWLRPWFNVQMMDFRAADDGSGALMHIVNTGLFPVLAGATRLVSGEDGVILSTDQLPSGAYALSPTPDPDWPVRVMLIAFCMVPFLASLLVRADDPLPVQGGLRVRPDRSARGWVLVPIAVVTIIAVVVLTSVSSSQAALAASVKNDTNSTATNTYFTCRGAAQSVGRSDTHAAYSVEGTGLLGLNLLTIEADIAGPNRTGIYRKAMTTTSSVACPRDQPRRAVVFDGSQCLYMPAQGQRNDPDFFTAEAWFSTTSRTSGKIIGYGDGATTDNTYWDRHIWIDTSGRLNYGLFPNARVVLSTPEGRSYADGAWHHVAATLSSAGASFYVDGALVGTSPSTTTGQKYTGSWRIGCGNLTNWTSNPSSFFTGTIQYAAVYTRALTATEIAAHAAAGR